MKLSGYKIHDLIGEGGMAKVYLATQESLDRQVALKVMDPALQASDKTFCNRFSKEGRIVAHLSHRNIVTIYDIGCQEPYYYMAMEYCGAGNLKQRIRQGIESRKALDITRQIAAALGFAHSLGFLHRDVKPGNILFKDEDTAVLSDFGIAKSMDSHTQLTAVGYTVGTPEYMSPEQATAKPLVPSSDLYSLGIVLYEMLTGKKPYTGPDPLSVAIMHLREPIPQLPPEFRWLQGLLDRLLAKTPDRRFADADQLIAELDRLDSRTGTGVHQTTRILSTSTGPAAVPDAGAGGFNGRLTPALWGVSAAAIALGVTVWLLPPPQQGKENGVPPRPEEAKVTGRQPAPERAVTPDAQVVRLLEIARAHRLVGRLTDPPGSNASEAYQMVLEADPDNLEAKAALAEIQRITGR